MTDLNYISKKQTVSTYCLLVKTTPRPPFDPAVFFFPLLQKKVNFLLSYANDLADQNQMLVQTIEDLQKEADGKTSNLVGKQRTSDHPDSQLTNKWWNTRSKDTHNSQHGLHT